MPAVFQLPPALDPWFDSATSRVGALLRPFGIFAMRGVGALAATVGQRARDAADAVLPRFTLTGPAGGADRMRIGIFAGLHGDEPASGWGLLDFVERVWRHPEIATGFELVLYPCCNPHGQDRGTRENGAGLDLNREFWRDSAQPEVRLLEHELRSQQFDGLVALHADDTCHGLYGFTRGRELAEELLRPALAAGAAVLPVDPRPVIDGFRADDSVIRDCYPGVLTAPPEQHPRPFEIIFETPARADFRLQRAAVVAVLENVLINYRRVMAQGAGI